MTEPERPSLTIPEELTRRAQALVDGSEQWTAPVARDAATVVLLRDGPAGTEVFVQRRLGAMAFAAGMHVFPGGRVEESDATSPWTGDASREPFGLPPDAAVTASFRALSAAAARETWEEAGVALASDGTALVRSSPATADADFVAWLRERGFTVAGDHFHPWTHWITPEVESRRFDTRFVVTAIPEGQEAVDRGVESDLSSWFRPAEALDLNRAGSMAMLPPTVDALAQLTAFDSVAAVLADAAARRPRPWLPRPFAGAGGAVEWRIVDAYTGEPIG